MRYFFRISAIVRCRSGWGSGSGHRNSGNFLRSVEKLRNRIQGFGDRQRPVRCREVVLERPRVRIHLGELEAEAEMEPGIGISKNFHFIKFLL